MRNIYVAVTYAGSPNVTRTFSLYPDEVGEGRLLSPLKYKAHVRTWVQQERTTSEISNVTISNSDGELDTFVNEEFISVQISESVDGTTTDLAFGYIDRVVINGTKAITIKLRNKTSDLGKPVQNTFFPASETSVSNGAETNTYYALEGQPYPLAIGILRSIKPVLAKRSINEYRCHDDDFYSIINVFDRGVVVSSTHHGSSFTLSADPDGVVVADIRGEENAGGTDGIRALDDVVEYLFDKLSITDYSLTDIQAVYTDKSYNINYYQDDKTNRTLEELLRWICDSFTGWFYTDESGDIRFGYLKEPSLSDDVEVTQFSVIGELNVFDDNAPNLTSKIGGNRNWFYYQSDEIASGATDQNKIDLAQQFRDIKDGANTIHSSYTDTKIPFDSLIQGGTNVQSEADNITSLYSQKRRFYSFDCSLDAGIGDTVKLKYPRFGLDSGVNLLCVGKEIDFINNTYRLTLWG